MNPAPPSPLQFGCCCCQVLEPEGHFVCPRLWSLASSASLQCDRCGRTTKEEAGIFIGVRFPTFLLIGSQMEKIAWMENQDEREQDQRRPGAAGGTNPLLDKTLARGKNLTSGSQKTARRKQQRGCKDTQTISVYA